MPDHFILLAGEPHCLNQCNLFLYLWYIPYLHLKILFVRMIPELRLCTTFDLFKALFCHANGIKIETKILMERVEFPKLHKLPLEKGLKSYQVLISKKKLEDARKTIRRKKNYLEGDLYFRPTKIEILKIQDPTSPKLVSPTETVSGAPRLYKLPNSLKSLFSPYGIIF